MFFEIAIGIKSIIVLVSLIGLFLGLFPDMPKHPKPQTITQAAPLIDNPWAAYVAAPDDQARSRIEASVKELEATAQQAADNAARVDQYQVQQATSAANLASSNRLMMWGLVGLCGVAWPMPKRTKGKHEHTN